MTKTASSQSIDFAEVNQKKYWLSHPVLGDPSFDTFERYPRNPICRGIEGLEWPVNGFLFKDPVSGNWYLYVGFYPKDYAAGADKEGSVCMIYRSLDAGKTWESVSPAFESAPFYFSGDSSPVKYAPDVSVVYAEGRYHMAYDWALAVSTWATICSRESGVGYAWSEKPEGPFHRHPEPIIRNDFNLQIKESILKKYRRLYATTIIRRAKDWLALSIIDSGPFQAWGFAGMVADRPEGPYRDLTALMHLEGNNYQPPLMEYFPWFMHEGWIYAPATSVALNRDFQIIHRAPIEEAMSPEAWELFRHGSLYHGVNLEHETHGMWGQTFSGFVDAENRFQIMFPSRDSKGYGTINLATCSWDKPLADSGFRMGGNSGPALALLKLFYDEFVLDAEFDLIGTACFFWGNTAPLGPNVPTFDSTLHSLSQPRGSVLRLNGNEWEFLHRADDESQRVIASGPLPVASGRTLRIQRNHAGEVNITLNGQVLYSGQQPSGIGFVGILVEKESYITVKRFALEGDAQPATLTWLHTEALCGAGQKFLGSEDNPAEWEIVSSAFFRHGVGAVKKAEGGRAKWNYFGLGATLWSPKGPEYGMVDIIVDNKIVGAVNLWAEEQTSSQPVFSIDDLSEDYHAFVLQPKGGKLVIDSLDVRCAVPRLDS